MLHESRFTSREEVTEHLKSEPHNWQDGPKFRVHDDSQMQDQYGRPWVPTSEYMAIHRELHLASPVFVVPAEARI